MTTPQQWLILGVFALIAALVLLGAAIAGSGRFGELPDVVHDQFVPQLPDRPLVPDDLRATQFGFVTRGYSPAQVDRLLQRAADDWDVGRVSAATPFAAWAPVDPPDA